MINPQTANMMACYKVWADKLIYDAVKALPPGEASRERPSLFKTMIGTLNHNYVVDLIWQANLQGRSHGFAARNMVLHPDLADLWDAQRSFNDWLLGWAEAQTEESLGEVVSFRFVSGEPARATRGEMLLHIVNHATYHRGWVTDMFYQIPAKPPTTDLSVFMVEAYAPGQAAVISLSERRRQCG
jgi:uncharacterized damage-inducible protein DinB